MNSNQLVLVRGRNPFAERQMNVLRYLDVNVQAGAASFETAYRGNSVFDPEVALGGHQPLGFDQVAAVYNEYLVHAATITVKFANLSAVPAVVGITAAEGSAALGLALEHYEELPLTKYKLLGGVNGAGTTTLRLHIRTKQIGGQEEKEALMADNFDAATTADPAAQWGFRVWGFDASGAANVNMHVNVKLTYYVEFYKPNYDLAQS